MCLPFKKQVVLTDCLKCRFKVSHFNQSLFATVLPSVRRSVRRPLYTSVESPLDVSGFGRPT